MHLYDVAFGARHDLAVPSCCILASSFRLGRRANLIEQFFLEDIKIMNATNMQQICGAKMKPIHIHHLYHRSYFWKILLITRVSVN